MAKESRQKNLWAATDATQGPQGYHGLRDLLADKLRRYRGIQDDDDILITTGSSPGIDPVSRLLVNPGETVILEEYCYAGAINRFPWIGANVMGVPLDEHGIRIDASSDMLAGQHPKGKVAKCLCLIPTIQNPAESILPLQRRQAIIELAKRYGIAIFADEC